MVAEAERSDPLPLASFTFLAWALEETKRPDGWLSI